jgi:hypothetical protein
MDKWDAVIWGGTGKGKDYLLYIPGGRTVALPTMEEGQYAKGLCGRRLKIIDVVLSSDKSNRCMRCERLKESE